MKELKYLTENEIIRAAYSYYLNQYFRFKKYVDDLEKNDIYDEDTENEFKDIVHKLSELDDIVSEME